MHKKSFPPACSRRTSCSTTVLPSTIADPGRRTTSSTSNSTWSNECSWWTTSFSSRSPAFWIFREVGKIAHSELAGEAQSITEQLRLLYMRLETGQITETEFDAEEKLLLDRLDAISSRLKDEEDSEEADMMTSEDDTGNP